MLQGQLAFCLSARCLHSPCFEDIGRMAKIGEFQECCVSLQTRAACFKLGALNKWTVKDVGLSCLVSGPSLQHEYNPTGCGRGSDAKDNDQNPWLEPCGENGEINNLIFSVLIHTTREGGKLKFHRQ